MISFTKFAQSLIAGAIFAVSVQTPTIASSINMPDLINQGFVIIDKQQHDAKEPGIFPYDKLVRVVSHTFYKLQRGGNIAQCTFVRDTQQETMSEICNIAN